MANMGVSLFEHMLQRQQLARQQELEQKRYDDQQQMGQWQRGLAEQDSQQKEKHNEFDRQFKVAQLLGQGAGLADKPTPTMKNPAAQEYADAGHDSSEFTLSKLIKQMAQKEADRTAREDIAANKVTAGKEHDAYGRETGQLLQDDKQEGDMGIQQFLEPGRNRRAAMMSESQGSSNILKALGLKAGMAKELYPNDPIDALIDSVRAEHGQDAVDAVQQALDAYLKRPEASGSRKVLRGDPALETIPPRPR